jgi:predicted RNase H-like HicB family nuclease
MNYPVIIEQCNGAFRALIPALSNLTAEGGSREEALHKAKLAAQDYLSRVEITSIEVENGPIIRRDSPQAVLQAAGKFVGDEEAMLQHIEEIYAERRKQREMVEKEYSAFSNGE